MSIAIHYTSIKPSTGQEQQVFGLQVAIADWLKAYFRYGQTDTFSFLIGETAEWKEIQSIAVQADLDPQRLVALDRRFPEKNLSHFTTVFRAEPDTRHMLWQRQLHGSFAFCGLAHAVSGVEGGEVLQDYCLAPSQACDAIICPSPAVRSAIRTFWNSYGDYLHQRFGTSYQCPVQLPVIPLGVDMDRLSTKVTPDKRAMQRQKLGLDDQDILILWVGRLSSAIKAHPLAMFQAAECAAQKTGARVHFVMVGYFIPDEAEGQFKKLATDICHKAKVTFLATNDKRFPDGLWAAADIFLSLVDNMQESFGLTPIEAMAAGLPRVISDWDGYRESVTDGEDGFLIRTTQPPAGNGFDLTTQVLSGREVYGGFLAKAALTVAVDAEQAGDRLAQLILDKSLRTRMADNARTRARATYDWRYIIPAYENVWNDLAARRQKREGVYPSALPQLPDPYTMYAAYPSLQLKEDDTLSLKASPQEINCLLGHDINLYAQDIVIPAADILALVRWLSQQESVALAQLLTHFSSFERPLLWRTIAWLQKMGIVKNSPCQAEG